MSVPLDVERLTLRCAHYARALEKMRSMLIAVHDELEDEGDRVYLGSTNHAELIHEAWHLADALKWDEIMRDTQPDTPLAVTNLKLQAEVRELRAALKGFLAWRDRVQNGASGCDYLNGDGADGRDGWEDLDALANKGRFALAKARGESA